MKHKQLDDVTQADKELFHSVAPLAAADATSDDFWAEFARHLEAKRTKVEVEPRHLRPE